MLIPSSCNRRRVVSEIPPDGRSPKTPSAPSVELPSSLMVTKSSSSCRSGWICQKVIPSAVQSSTLVASASDSVPSGQRGRMTPVPSGQKWHFKHGNWNLDDAAEPAGQ